MAKEVVCCGSVSSATVSSTTLKATAKVNE